MYHDSDMSEAGRLFGVYWEPRPVFEDLAARQRWWVPLILLTVLALVYVFAFSQIVGWETMMRQELAGNPRVQQLPVEQQERIIAQQIRFAPIMGYVGALIGVLGGMLVVALVLLGIFRVGAGGGLTYRQVFSVCCYASVPNALATILSIVAMKFTNPEDFDIRNPLALNASWLLDKSTTAKWLYSAAGSLDLFAIWVALLMAFGLSVAAKTVSFGRSLGLVVAGWLIWIVVKSGAASLFG